MKTTNGTGAFQACPSGSAIYAGSFFNLEAMSQRILAFGWKRLILVASGHYGGVSQEDLLGAGALIDRVGDRFGPLSDAGRVALRLYRSAKGDLFQAVCAGEHARRLLEDSELSEDVPAVLHFNKHPVLVKMDSTGRLRREAA